MHIKYAGEEIEQVIEFKYLGSIIENTGSTTKEVITRIGQANAAFNQLKESGNPGIIQIP